MRFDPEQEELRRTVRTLLERAAGGDVWRLLAEQVGAHALAIPEEYGGAGFSMLETHVVLEELGAALAAPGFLSTTLAAQAILCGESEEARTGLLPGLAAGGTRAAVAFEAVEAVEEAAAGGRWRLSGSAHHVLDGGDADLVVVPARLDPGSAPQPWGPGTDGKAANGSRGESVPGSGVSDQQPWQRREAGQGANGSRGESMPGSGVSDHLPWGPGTGLFLIAAADAAITPVETVDPGRPQARVDFRRTAATLLTAEPSALDRVLDLACVAISAEQVGAAQRAFDLTLAYAKQRVQFGRPIGSFQAVKHRLADLFTLLESARSASYAAAFAAVSGHEFTVAASRAKAYCSEAFSTIAGEAIQLHGGIGITWEHPIHLYFKRAHATSHAFGSPAWHRRRYARAVGLVAA